MYAHIVYVELTGVSVSSPFCLFSPLPHPPLLTPLSLRTLGDICLTQHTHTQPPTPNISTHTPAGRPSPRSGSAAEKVTGWATIKRVRARTSFVTATRDADRELLSSVNDKSMKFPSCSGRAPTKPLTDAQPRRLAAAAAVAFSPAVICVEKWTCHALTRLTWINTQRHGWRSESNAAADYGDSGIRGTGGTGRWQRICLFHENGWTHVHAVMIVIQSHMHISHLRRS